MRLYLRLLYIFYKNNIIGELEYRLNFWSSTFLSLFWLLWGALTVQIYFVHAKSIAGWTYNEILVVVGMFFLMNGLRQAFIAPNLGDLSDHVRLGTLDYMLLRPVSSQFLVSWRRLNVYACVQPFLGGGLIGYALWQLHRAPDVGRLLLFLILTGAAFAILYSITFILQTTTVWLVGLRRADTVVLSAIEAGRFPIDFYRGWVRTALTIIIPVAFLTTFPSEALLGRLGGAFAVPAVGVAVVLCVLASIYWRAALRSYTGASS